MGDLLPIVEVFGPTIQGEGVNVGRPAVFVRFGGCDNRCLWCDTPYAIDRASPSASAWARLTPRQIVAQVRTLTGVSRPMVVLTGGNPALHDLRSLVAELRQVGYYVAVETQGTIPRTWFGVADFVTFSPKPPSSGCQTDTAKLLRAVARADRGREIKIVIMHEEDLAYARQVKVACSHIEIPIGLSCGTWPEETKESLLGRYRSLVEEEAGNGWSRILPQLHVLAWGHDRGR